ncbi:MAG: hypothetical protein QF578_11415 [Alphaproteobacteria bacterium]|nr:hypothetical protein [Alphaproteobacteria bacterium]MDP6565425.1 hypothetical protein [Alphaproteobacteria bacterium]MDP6816104.1 hypothetical protein [Alphaproteobacteria bacterium]
MEQLPDIGTRVELVSSDKYFRDISIGLYARETAGGWLYRVHSYAGYDGAAARLDSIVMAMKTLGGMDAGPTPGLLRFPCGAAHPLAVRRLFLQACKLDPTEAPAARPLSVVDRKTGLTASAAHDGAGGYGISASGEAAAEHGPRRIAAIRNGLVKLSGAAPDAAADGRFSFDCGRGHDALVGLLLQNAPDVRVAMRELAANAARGVLAAPGSQE